MRGCDFAFKKDGVPTTGEPDELGATLRSHKADQESFGWSKSHFKSDHAICVVTAVWQVAVRMPQRFGVGAEARLPFARWENGRQLTREDVQKVLKKAATAVGLPSERFMTHSLRVGGASALYHAVNDVEIVKRWGRWSSTAFHRYLWDSSEQARDLASRMARDEASIHYT